MDFREKHPKLSKAIIIALLVVLFLVLVAIISPIDTIVLDYIKSYKSSKSSTDNKLKVDGYSFHQGQDSPNGNIGNQADLVNNTTGLAKYCDSMPNCTGFNTNGWVKSSIKPESEWTRWTEDKSKGLFVKNKEHYSNFPGAFGSPMTDPFD